MTPEYWGHFLYNYSIMRPLPALTIPSLISAYKTVAKLYVPEMIYAPVVLGITDKRDDGEIVFKFNIPDFCHGVATAIITEERKVHALTIIQITADDFIYSAFYSSRHGNKELNTLLLPLLTEKIIPELQKLV